MSFFFRSQAPTVPCYTEQKNTIRSHHFCLKVLTAMYELQTGNSAYNRGIKSKDIMRYMQEKFELDGDVKTQVHISLQQSLAYGFITKEFGKYKLVGPMAKVIQEPHDSQDRINEIERVVKIFWNSRKFPSVHNKFPKSSLNVPHAAEVSCSSICGPAPRNRSLRRKRQSPSRSISAASQASGSTMRSASTVVTKRTSESYHPAEKRRRRRRKTPYRRIKKGRARKTRPKNRPSSQAVSQTFEGDTITEFTQEDRQ